MTDSWDGNRPNLSKLPPHIRQGLHQPIPLRPGEIYVKLNIFKKVHQTGLNHPTARVLSKPYRDDENEIGPFAGVQIECHEFRGREELCAFRVSNGHMAEFLKTFILAAQAAGMKKEEIQELINE